MLGTLAMLPILGGTEPASLVLDLFLVARNEWRVDDLAWLKKSDTDGAQGVLRSRLTELEAQKTNYMILEGGDCPLYPKGDEWLVKHTERTFEEYDAFTETTIVRGVEKKKVLARNLSVGASSGGVYVQLPAKKLYYTSRTYSYPFGHDKAKPSVCFQDVNSYRLVKQSKQAEDQASLDKTILFSALPLAQTRQFLADEKLDFDGVCISPSGLPQKDAPNLIAFPPSGVIAHYALTREGNRWTVRLLDYLTAPNGEGRLRKR